MTDTPMMKQYKDIKAKYKDTILLYRLGDFYEMFNEDAHRASKILNITLTSRGKTETGKIPMCGIPHHAANGYVAKLIKAGIKVAICEQVEEASEAKGIVKREVTRIITPGTVLDDILLSDKHNNFLSAVNVWQSAWALSFLDLSTGEFKVTEFEKYEDLLNELIVLSPAECILPKKLYLNERFISELKLQEFVLSAMEDYEFDYDDCYLLLKNHFKTQSLDGFGVENMVAGICAAGAILKFLRDNLHKSLNHISRISCYSSKKYMIVDHQTSSNLEIIESRNKGEQEVSLLNVLDDTVTSMGGRLLRQYLKQPLYDVSAIHKRQAGIKCFFDNYSQMVLIREELKDIRDIERILSRINCGYANAKDIMALKDSLDKIPILKEVIKPFRVSIIEETNDNLLELNDLIALINLSIVDDPPTSIREGGMIKEGFSAELDELKKISKEGKKWLAEFQEEEIKRTNIKSLKVKYNQVFGYYIEITKTNLDAVPENYIRKQTLSNAERFITAEIKEYETKILHAKEKREELEYTIFLDIRAKLALKTAQLQKVARGVAVLDVLVSLAHVAVRNNYILPEINNSDCIDIKDGRHPTIEKILGEGEFVPNDIFLNCTDNQLMLITGPNMAGKSTFIRQVALLILMAQTGSFIPAKYASIGVVDRIFTRVGASDNLIRGQSTFMVEMNETANILNNATKKSLIILDEIGRGTSTFDGISIAWAVAEYLSQKEQFKAKTLFATHYHELTSLENSLPGVKNYNIAVKEWNEEIIFLRKIVPGEADKSYGIHVARLAGIPKSVLERAKDILNLLEQGEHADLKLKPLEQVLHKDTLQQLTLFKEKPHILIEKIKEFSVNDCTPLQALNFLNQLKKLV